MNLDLERVLDHNKCRVEEREEYAGESAHVFHISEAFGHGPASRNIAESALALLKAGNVPLICMEAVFGEADVSELQKFKEAKDKYGDPATAVETGKLTYLQYLFMMWGGEFELYGVEDRVLYLKVLELAKQLIVKKNEWANRVSGMILELQRDGLANLSSDYADFFRRVGNLADNTEPLSFEMLFDYATKLSIESDVLRNFRRISDTKQLEAEIDFERANQEATLLQQAIAETLSDRDRFILNSLELAGIPIHDTTPRLLVDQVGPDGFDEAGLASAMRRTPLERLLHYGLRRGAGESVKSVGGNGVMELFQRSFDLAEAELMAALAAQEQGPQVLWKLYSTLIEFTPLFNVELGSFPNVVRYAHYLSRFLLIDMTTTITEFDNLRLRIISKLAATEADRRHARLIERLGYLQKLCGLVCLPDDARWLQSRLTEMSHTKLSADLQLHLPGSLLVQEFAAVEGEYEDRFEDSLKYYSLMTERGNAMARNTLGRMRDRGFETAIMVTGGYHRATIAANFERFRVPHTMILPVIQRATSDQEMEDYFNRLANQ